jgi:hypothetical protein
MNRKRLTLVILVGLLIVCLGYAFWATPRQEIAAPKSAVKPVKRSGNTVKQDRMSVDSVVFQSGESADEKVPFPGAKRDIFNFFVRKPVAPPRPQVVAPPPPTPVAPRPVMPQPDPLVQMQRALGKFTFLGFLEKNSVKSIFLKSSSDIYVVKVGQSFGEEDEFYVDSITDQELVARHKQQGSTVTVKLVENEQLSPSVSAPARPTGGASSSFSEAPQQPVMPKRRTVRFPNRNREVINAETDERQDEFEQPYDQEPPAPGDETEGGPHGSNR